MREQPDHLMLIQSVIEFIRDRALPELQGPVRFQAPIACNLLEMVQRELRLTPDADADELSRLKDLLGAADGDLELLNARLSEGIVNGQIDVRTSSLHNHLWATTMDKLAVD